MCTKSSAGASSIMSPTKVVIIAVDSERDIAPARVGSQECAPYSTAVEAPLLPFPLQARPFFPFAF